MDKKLQEKFIQKITGLSKEQLFLNKPELSLKEQEKLNEYISRYNKWEPIEYILELSDFYSLEFFVDKRVLIPRNDTELLVEKVIDELSKFNTKTLMIDIWTWSSCIPISVMKNLPNPFLIEELVNCYAIDISNDALEVAEINIKNHLLESKIKLIHWDLLKPFLLDTSFLSKDESIGFHSIIITANLPYIKNNDFWNMDNETIEFEPDLALYWWENTWFELYESLIYECLELTCVYNLRNLILFIEIGFDQNQVAESFLKQIWLKFEFFKDANKIDRVIKIIF